MKKHTTFIGIKLNNKTDADILDRLAEKENRQGYIKTLIRQDIEHSRTHPEEPSSSDCEVRP